jgi:hypothetical protein
MNQVHTTPAAIMAIHPAIAVLMGWALAKSAFAWTNIPTKNQIAAQIRTQGRMTGRNRKDDTQKTGTARQRTTPAAAIATGFLAPRAVIAYKMLQTPVADTIDPEIPAAASNCAALPQDSA